MQKPAQPTATLTHFLDFSKASPEAGSNPQAPSMRKWIAPLGNRFPFGGGRFSPIGIAFEPASIIFKNYSAQMF